LIILGVIFLGGVVAGDGQFEVPVAGGQILLSLQDVSARSFFQ
jgi:hypothetical protein